MKKIKVSLRQLACLEKWMLPEMFKEPVQRMRSMLNRKMNPAS